MPRGQGKSTLCKASALWALLYGHHKFVFCIAADDTLAKNTFDSIKTWLEVVPSLYDDFPEVCYPIRALEGIAHRCNGQTYLGERTGMKWTADTAILPTIPGSKASGSIIVTKGMTGRMRGTTHTNRDGSVARPTLMLIDDPQTDESARSTTQTHDRINTIVGEVKNMVGPKDTLSVVMPCTVIYPDDLADQMLDRQHFPDWQGLRTELLPEMASQLGKWETYDEIRRESLRVHGDIRDATAYYLANREELDKGYRASWPERYPPGMESAIQYGMTLLLENEASFWSEFQNKPKILDRGDIKLKPGDIFGRINNLKRRVCPSTTEKLTAFIDVQGEAVYYCVTAWSEGMTGDIIDYGTWPEQPVRNFALYKLPKPGSAVTGIQNEAGRQYAMLEALTDDIMTRQYEIDGRDTVQQIDLCMIDAGYGPDTVNQFIKQSPHGMRMIPSLGRYFGAKTKGINELPKKEGERIGHYWRSPVPAKRTLRYVFYDSNYWKSWVHQSIKTPMGDKTALRLYGQARDNERGHHAQLADHILSEYCVLVEAKGRAVWEWTLRPGQRDNHWLDCVSGTCVAAAMVGMVADKWKRKGDSLRPKRRRMPKYGAVGKL